MFSINKNKKVKLFNHVISRNLTKNVFSDCTFKIKRNECYYDQKRLGPMRSGDKEVYEERWYLKSNIVHRKYGPAIVVKTVKEQIVVKEHWVIFDKTHRTSGPAIILYDNEGLFAGEYWYENGVQHRLFGPSCTILLNGIKKCWWRTKN